MSQQSRYMRHELEAALTRMVEAYRGKPSNSVGPNLTTALHLLVLLPLYCYERRANCP